MSDCLWVRDAKKKYPPIDNPERFVCKEDSAFFCMPCLNKFYPKERVMSTKPDVNNFHPAYLQSHPGIKAALESGEIEGVPFRLLEGEIEPGDTYIAERNVGLQLLTCKVNNKERWWIQPVEQAYSYDTGECIKIELIID